MRTLTHDEARQRAALLQVASYDVHLVLTEDEAFVSTVRIVFQALADGASFLELDGELLEGDLDGERLALQGNRLPLALTAGEHVATVRARCRTTRTGEGLHRSVDPADGRTYLYAQAFLDDAQRVFACFDQPDLKARFTTTVEAPPGWTVLSNTTATTDAGTHAFTPTEPLPTYLWTVAAGPWHGVTETTGAGLRLGVWCRQSLAEHLEAPELLEITRQCLAFQERVFGRAYPFGMSYDQVFVPEFNAGAMENAGMITFSDELFVFRSRTTQGRRRLRAQVVAHEMAHMWFGDLVTMRWWDDLWLNESFAELLGVHTVEQATAYDGAWADFCLGRKAWGYRADQLPTTHPVAGKVADNRAALLNFDGISYAKGASALRQLMAVLGEDVFLDGVRRYLARHAWGNTQLADLLAALEEASGRDLRAWAEVWLRTSGVPLLRVDGTDLVQVADVQRPHTVAVGLYDDDGSALVLRERLLLEVAGERTPLPGPATPDEAPADLVLPNDGDLTFAKVRLDARSLATALAGVGRLADPLARALVWGALWDACRDAELAPAALVRAVLGGLHAERDPEVVATLLAQATTAATQWTAQGAPLLAELSAHCLGAAAADPGSDLQLVLWRAAVSATTDAGLLGGQLDGSASQAGLVVDGEQRWHVLRRRSVLGLVTADDVEAELARDRASSSESHAAWSLAARPDPAAKAAAWVELLGDGELTNARARALADGFWQPGQQEVTGPYVERYAAEVPGLWERRGPQLAGSTTRLLFPSTLVDQRVLDLTAPLVTGGPPGMVRTVLEQRDDLARALRARQASDRPR